ncbi:hypothetical protein TPR58_02855 [Sphingomonas sp. HF-S3]|uniref:Response regulatory domain-containing protein n=1 Tax=Sphingomonas rustica TaxID=3103142 RepID=A0ABV0B3C6_9SPHN
MGSGLRIAGFQTSRQAPAGVWTDISGAAQTGLEFKRLSAFVITLWARVLEVADWGCGSNLRIGRSNRHRPDLKILFITGYAENAVLSHGHLAPGMHVLIKPFTMDDIASRIRDLIET